MIASIPAIQKPADFSMTERSEFLPAGAATLIGSLPVHDYEEALELILAHTPEIPLWPQLPGNPAEGMLQQFSENLPGFCEETGKAFFRTSSLDFAERHLAFFEAYLAAAEDPARLDESLFASSPARVPGLYQLQARLTQSPPAGLRAVKGQITGPFTLLTGLKDEQRQDAWYDPTIHEIVVKGLALRAAWQARFLAAAGKPVLIFLDEPALAGLGSSAYISVSLEEIGRDLDEVLTAVRQAGGLAGIHVCANTDWDFLLERRLDILSFDAYGFFDRLIGSKKALYAFLDRGGILAWGLVPTAEPEAIARETASSLAARWQQQAEQLVNGEWDLARILQQSLITPSCGTGSLNPAEARRVLELTRDLTSLLRKNF
jgi:methionine synthase II (cobalamin-independent)